MAAASPEQIRRTGGCCGPRPAPRLTSTLPSPYLRRSTPQDRRAPYRHLFSPLMSISSALPGHSRSLSGGVLFERSCWPGFHASLRRVSPARVPGTAFEAVLVQVAPFPSAGPLSPCGLGSPPRGICCVQPISAVTAIPGTEARHLGAMAFHPAPSGAHFPQLHRCGVLRRRIHRRGRRAAGARGDPELP